MEIKPETPVYKSRQKVADLTPEEAETRRRRTRASVRKSRRKQKTEKVLLEATAEDQTKIFVEHFPDEKRISQYIRTIERKIAEELPELTDTTPAVHDILREPEDEFVFYVASVCCGLEGYGVFVDEHGLKIGGLYADAAAATVVEFVRMNPLLLKSATFTALYRAMLGVYERYRHLPNVDPKDLEIIRAELKKDNNGTSFPIVRD